MTASDTPDLMERARNIIAWVESCVADPTLLAPAIAKEFATVANEARSVALIEATGCCAPKTDEAWTREAQRTGALIEDRISNLRKSKPIASSNQ